MIIFNLITAILLIVASAFQFLRGEETEDFSVILLGGVTFGFGLYLLCLTGSEFEIIVKVAG